MNSISGRIISSCSCVPSCRKITIYIAVSATSASRSSRICSRCKASVGFKWATVTHIPLMADVEVRAWHKLKAVRPTTSGALAVIKPAAVSA